MKLRQKLAAVLAASMVVTAVPVTTFAASTNKLSHRVAAVKGTITGTAANELATEGDYINRSLRLNMDFGTTVTNLPTTFYVGAEDCEFVEAEYQKFVLGAMVNSAGLETTIKVNLQLQFSKIIESDITELTIGKQTVIISDTAAVDDILVTDVKIELNAAGVYEVSQVAIQIKDGVATKAITDAGSIWFEADEVAAVSVGTKRAIDTANKDLVTATKDVAKDLKNYAVVITESTDYGTTNAVGAIKAKQLVNRKAPFIITGEDSELVTELDVKDINDVPVEDGDTTTKGAIATKRIYTAPADTQMVVEYLNSSTLRVTLLGKPDGTQINIGVPIFAKITTDTKVPYITVRDQDSFATNGKYALTDEEVNSDKRLSATIDKDLKLTVDGGELGKLTIKEREEYAIKNAKQRNNAVERLDEIAYELEDNLTSSEMSALKNERKNIMNNMKHGTDDYTALDNSTTFNDEQFIYVKLPKNSDLKFSKTQSAKLEGKFAFAPNTIPLERKNSTNYNDDTKATYEFIDEDYAVDYQTLRIRLPKQSVVGTTTGEWEIKGLDVEPEDAREEAVVGEFTLTVKGDLLKTLEEKLTVVEYGTSLKCEKPVALVAGKESKEVEVVLVEDVTDSLDDKRWVTFTLPEGMYIKADREYVKNDSIKDLVTVKIGSDEIAKTGYDLTNVVKNIDGDIVGFKLELEYKDDDDNLDGYLKQGEVNKVTMKFNVQAATNFKPGEALITAESRAFANDKDAKDNKKSVKIADVTAPVEAKFETTEVKVGLEKQAGKKITIKETEKNMLEKGLLYVELTDGKIASKREDIKLSVNDGSTLDAEVKAIKDGIMTIEIKRQSKEASELTIDGLTYTIDRTVPEGGIDLELYGPALRSYDGVWADTCYNDAANRHNNQKSAFVENIFCCYEEDEHRLNFDKVIDVPTKNTEDIGSASGKAVEAKFVIGSNKYTVNGEEKTMDAAAFAQDGRTMIPVRFLCEALGLPGDALSYSGKNIAIVTNDRAIGLTAGSKTMMVDGVPVQMSAATVVKNGRTYAPVSEIARALGLTSNWDAASKTATFTK